MGASSSDEPQGLTALGLMRVGVALLGFLFLVAAVASAWSLLFWLAPPDGVSGSVSIAPMREVLSIVLICSLFLLRAHGWIARKLCPRWGIAPSARMRDAFVFGLRILCAYMIVTYSIMLLDAGSVLLEQGLGFPGPLDLFSVTRLAMALTGLAIAVLCLRWVKPVLWLANMRGAEA